MEHGHLGMSARGAAERRTSRLQYRIDHAGPAKERRRAQEERVQLQVEAPSLIALKRSTRSFELNAPAIRQRLVGLPSGFHGYTAGHAGRVPVQERRAEQQHSANARGIECFARVCAKTAEKSSRRTPYFCGHSSHLLAQPARARAVR